MDDDTARPADTHAVKARPLSGEIMSAGAARGQRPQDDVADADFETVSPRPDAASRSSAGAAGTPAAGLDFLRRKAAEEDGRSRRGGVLFWSAGLLLAGLGFWVAGGHALIAPGVPAPGARAKTPLAIADVKSRVETHGGRAVLFVEGRAANGGGETMALPPIEIAVTANDGNVARYLLAATDTHLKPGDRYSFSSRLEAPASGVRTVSVAFQEDER